MEGIPDQDKCEFPDEDWIQRNKSVEFLSNYLKEAVRLNPVSLYVTWAGEEDAPLQYTRTVSPDYFGGDSFFFKEHGLFNVIPN